MQPWNQEGYRAQPPQRAPPRTRPGASPALACVPRFGANRRDLTEILLGRAGLPAGKQSWVFRSPRAVGIMGIVGAGTSCPEGCASHAFAPGRLPPCAPGLPQPHFLPAALSPGPALHTARHPGLALITGLWIKRFL